MDTAPSRGTAHPTAPRVVVFDFDLTLTRWDTADRFFRWLLRRELWRLALVLLALPVLAPLLLLGNTRKLLIRYAVWVATLGRTNASMAALAEAHIDSLPEGHASVFLPDAVSQLRTHQDRGDRVVIATGCLQPLASALLARAELAHVPLVASTLKPFLGGLVRDQHCFGAHKVAMLTANGFPPPWAVAYTDHHADLPVLHLSAERYLINPQPACLARIEAAMGCDANLLSWRP